MVGPRVCHTECSKSEREKQIPYANTYILNIKTTTTTTTKNSSEEPRGRTGIKTQTYRMDLRTRTGGMISWDKVREWHGHIYTTIRLFLIALSVLSSILTNPGSLLHWRED